MHLISVRLSSLTIFFFKFFTWCFVLLPFISLYNRSGMSENHVKKGNRRLCCRAEDYENLFLSTQTIFLGEIVAHEALSNYGVWFLVIYLFIWDYEANSFYILLTLFYFMKTLFWEIQFFLALLSAYHFYLWYVFY